MILILLVHN